jgi:hypothetical protein
MNVVMAWVVARLPQIEALVTAIENLLAGAAPSCRAYAAAAASKTEQAIAGALSNLLQNLPAVLQAIMALIKSMQPATA